MRSEERNADRIAEKLYNNDLYCYRAVGRDKALKFWRLEDVKLNVKITAYLRKIDRLQ